MPLAILDTIRDAIAPPTAVIEAISVKPITYTDYNGIDVVLDTGTLLRVDTALGIALAGDTHFAIFTDEYTAVT